MTYATYPFIAFLVSVASAAPSLAPVPLQLTVRQQQQQIAALQAKADQEKAELDAIDQKTDQLEKNEQEPSAASQELDDARTSLAALETLKQSLIEQQNQSFLEQRTERNEFKIDAQLRSTRLKEKLVREEAVARDLDRRLQEQQASNLNTDEQHELEAQAPAQNQRVAELEAQYREFEVQQADDEAQNYASTLASSAAVDDLAALDQQIRAQQEVVSKVAVQVEKSQSAQQAGVSENEVLQDRYVELKRDYGELSRQLEVQKQALASRARSNHES